MESRTLSNDNLRVKEFMTFDDFKFVKASIIDEILFDNKLMVTTEKFDRFADAATIQTRFGEVAEGTFCKYVNEFFNKDKIPCFWLYSKAEGNTVVYGKLITVTGYKSVIIIVPVYSNGKHACNFRFGINKYDDGKLTSTRVENLINIEQVAEWCDPYDVAQRYIDVNFDAFGIRVELSSFNVKESQTSKMIKDMMNSIRI